MSAVDAAGVLVSTAPVNVTCSVLSGPGRVVGVGAGDPASHEQPNGDTVATVGGVVRCLVQVGCEDTEWRRGVRRGTS